MTPDGTPIIGATPLANLYLATGHGTLGWTMAAGTGRVIADLQMSGLSGLELQGWLIKRGHRISFILVTGYPDEGCRTRALSAGAVGFLTKPVDDESLMRCLIAAVGPPN